MYGIIDQSGGGIALDTAPGRGTSVRIYLPVTSATGDRNEQGETPTVIVRGGTETLLLVEDNDSVRQVTAEALRRRGYTVLRGAATRRRRSSGSRLPRVKPTCS